MEQLKENIVRWLDYCEDLEVKPWEYDFKQAYRCESIQNNTQGISLMMEYKNSEFNEIGFRLNKLDSTKRKGKTADADKEANEVYKVLWPYDKTGVMRGDAMNSYITTFNTAYEISDNSKNIQQQLGFSEKRDYEILKNSYLEFNVIAENLNGFNRFGKLTHTLGNFIIIPHWMNTGRYNFSKDYWDVTMQSMKDFLEPLQAWENFINTYQLQIYVTKDKLEVSPLWKHHLSCYGMSGSYLPKNSDNISEFLDNVNRRIEYRGKYLTKVLLETLDLKKHIFYQDVKDMEILYADQL